MSGIVRDLSPAALADAIEANFLAFFAAVGRTPGKDMYEGPDMMWLITPGVPHPIFNGVFRARFSQDEMDAKIDETLAHFRSANVPITWWTGPATRPHELGTYLERHGLEHSDDWPGMAVDLQAMRDDLPAPPGLTIERVTGLDTLDEWTQVACAIFELPEIVRRGFFDTFSSLGLGEESAWGHYAAWMEGKMIGTSTLFLGAGVAGIYNVSTAPEVRGRGVGSALTVRPLREARELGYRVGILQSSPMGYSVYRKLGFEEYCKLGLYGWAGSSHSEQPQNGSGEPTS